MFRLFWHLLFGHDYKRVCATKITERRARLFCRDCEHVWEADWR